jgi:hypothetical protein
LEYAVSFDVSASACSAALKATGNSGIDWRRLTSFANVIVLLISASSSLLQIHHTRAPPFDIALLLA